MWNDTTVSLEVTWFESGSKDLVICLRFQARFTEVPLQNLYSKWLPHRLNGPIRQALQHNALRCAAVRRTVACSGTAWPIPVQPQAAVFASMALTATVPSVHGITLYGAAQFHRQIGLSWLLTQGLLYLVGAAIYAVSREYLRKGAALLTQSQARVPERWRPRRFDIWGSSHQIFHILVVLAAAAHLVGLLKAFDYEHEYRSGLVSA